MSLSGIAAASIVFIPYFLGNMGAGDVKLFLSLGFIMGPGILILMFTTLLALALFFVFSWIKNRSKRLNVPLAPFILLGYLVLGGGIFAIFYI